MDLKQVIESRKSTRAFLDTPISQKDLSAIFNAARLSPSASNLQPWEFWGVSGKEKDELVQKLLDEQKKTGATYLPGKGETLPERFVERSTNLMTKMLPYLEKAGIHDPHWIMHGSLSFYGAPAAILLLLDEDSHATEIDIGLAMQNMLLSAHNQGLGTCPLGLPVLFNDLIKNHLNIPASLRIVNVVAIGYPDFNNPINAFKSERVPLESITKFIGFEAI